ncbi:MAG: hypothetical protein ACR2FY_01360 [Pirellulaceae bacterium]
MALLALSSAEDAKKIPSQATILAAHESTWAQIQSAKVVIKHESKPNERGVFARSGVDVWKKFDLKESFERTDSVQDANASELKVWSCYWYDFEKMEETSLRLPEPAHRNDMTPIRNYGAQCKRAPLARNHLYFQVYLYFLMRLPANVADEFRTLSELAREADSFTIVGSEQRDGIDLIRIDAIHPRVRGSVNGARMTIFVDPNAGFLCRELRSEQFSSDGKQILGVAVTRVLEFQDLGRGVFFPKSSENWIEDSSGKRMAVNRFSVVSHSVNADVQASELNPALPENVYMNLLDEPHTPFSKPKETRIALIGKNSTIKQVFYPGTNELAAFMNDYRLKQGSPPKSIVPISKEKEEQEEDEDPMYARMAWGAIVCVCVVLLLIWRIRRPGIKVVMI